MATLALLQPLVHPRVLPDDDAKDDDTTKDTDTDTAKADDDKDNPRSRSRASSMTRAEIHRATRAKDKLAKSGKYGNVAIDPHGPGPSRNRMGDDGMNAGNMLRSAIALLVSWPCGFA